MACVKGKPYGVFAADQARNGLGNGAPSGDDAESDDHCGQQWSLAGLRIGIAEAVEENSVGKNKGENGVYHSGR